MKKYGLKVLGIGFIMIAFFFLFNLCLTAGEEGKPQVLQEMSWMDVQENLKNLWLSFFPGRQTEIE